MQSSAFALRRSFLSAASIRILQAFDLEGKQAEIEAIKKENAFMAELQSRIVPLIVQHETFWTRYFYQYASCLVH